MQCAPVSLRALLWSKFWLIAVPLLFLGVLLVFLSNLLLQVAAWMMALSLITVSLMTFGIAAIGVGFGAIYPHFDYDNAAEIPTSFGGAVSMIVSVGFIALVVMVEAWPIYQLAAASLRPSHAVVPTLWLIAPSLAIVAALTAVAIACSLRIGMSKLEQLRD
jgi:ABC-2 type transport system permease protein